MLKDFSIETFVFLNKIKELTQYLLMKLADGASYVQCVKLAEYQLCAMFAAFWLVLSHSTGQPDAHAAL